MDAPLKLFRLTQTSNTGYDTFSEAVVVARTPAEAAQIYPKRGIKAAWDPAFQEYGDEPYGAWVEDHGNGYRAPVTAGATAWAPPDEVTAEDIGIAAAHLQAGTVVCASFHAG